LDIRVLVQRLHHRDNRAILQKRQLAGAEVIEQRAEWLQAQSHLPVQLPPATGVEAGRRCGLRFPRASLRGHGQ
jgi:hypothetical protein